MACSRSAPTRRGNRKTRPGQSRTGAGAARLGQRRLNKVRGNPDIGMTDEAMQMQEATAAYNAAKASYELLQSGAAPEVAHAAAAIGVAQAELDALKEAQPGELAEAAALVQQAQAALEFVQTGARVEEIAVAQGDVDIATALMQAAFVAVCKTELRAPFDGVVTTLDIERGGDAQRRGAASGRFFRLAHRDAQPLRNRARDGRREILSPFALMRFRRSRCRGECHASAWWGRTATRRRWPVRCCPATRR